MSLALHPAMPFKTQPGRWVLPVNRLGNMALGLIVFLSGFVFFEPAPYELLIIPLLVVWFACGLTLHRAFLPLTFFMFCFICGGAIGATQKANIGGAFFYIVVTAFLATTSIFYAAIIAHRTQDRLKLIFSAYTASALIGSLIGILAYFHILPNSELFLFGGRARGPFQDPNVFGPFLVLPTIFLLRGILIRPLLKSFWQIVALLILLAAIFLAFSRAAWGLCLLSCLLITLVVFIDAKSNHLRSRIMLITLFMGFALIGLMALALSFDAISTLFQERAKLVQSYDSAQFGRFARYSYGVKWIMEAPLGYGFGKFRETFGEDTHNIYIKSFMVYGWLGGISYLCFIGTTLVVGFKHLFAPRPWQAYFQCCYIMIFGHALVGMIVDIDRWRHLYLIYGICWGMIAANALWQKHTAREA